MASYTVNISKHATLAANVIDTCTFSRDLDRVEVLNRGSAEIYLTAEGQTPSIGGDDTYVVAAGAGLLVEPSSANNTIIKLISTVACPYSITAG
jgi:hypothetical protein